MSRFCRCARFLVCASTVLVTKSRTGFVASHSLPTGVAASPPFAQLSPVNPVLLTVYAHKTARVLYKY